MTTTSKNRPSNCRNTMRLTIAGLLPLLCVVLAHADSNVDASNKYAWGENIGWMNWRDAGQLAGAQGAHVHDSFLSGFVWAENVGWINLGNGTPTNGVAYENVSGADFGVNVEPATGELNGLAWGENIGWINFSAALPGDPDQPPTFTCGGRLVGFVWTENIGWINLSSTDPGKFVSLDAASRPYACDMNHDGASDGRDVQAFTNLLLLGGADWKDTCSGDVEPVPDGTIDFDDVAPFVDCVLNG